MVCPIPLDIIKTILKKVVFFFNIAMTSFVKIEFVIDPVK